VLREEGGIKTKFLANTPRQEGLGIEVGIHYFSINSLVQREGLEAFGSLGVQCLLIIHHLLGSSDFIRKKCRAANGAVFYELHQRVKNKLKS